jgi:lipocalin
MKMAGTKYFISLQHIRKVVQYYGGFRKYEIMNTNDEYSIIHFHEKKNHKLWLTIRAQNANNDIQVTFTDETGFIVKRDYWYMVDKQLIKSDLEERFINRSTIITL